MKDAEYEKYLKEKVWIYRIDAEEILEILQYGQKHLGIYWERNSDWSKFAQQMIKKLRRKLKDGV